MTIPPYGSYRPSKLEWLGEVPSHWTDCRLRHVVQLNPSKAETAHRPRDEEVSFVPMDAIGEDGSLRLDQTRPIGDVDSGYTYFRDGDVVLAKITPCFENGKGAIMRGLVGGVGFGTTELIVARPKTGVSNSFIHWLFNSTAFRRFAEGAMYGAGGQKRVPDEFVRNFPVSLPPRLEQVSIASFLDRETAKIDALVEAQQGLIDLLNEKRQAIISRAISRGLDPGATNKASCIEFYQLIPDNWGVVRLRSVVRKIESGTSVNSIDIPVAENEIGVLKTSSVYSGEFELSENKKVVDEDLSRVSCPVKAETLIVSRMNTPDLVGSAGLSLCDCENIYLPDRLWQIYIEGMSPEFVHYWTKSEIYRHQIKLACAGTSSSMQNISQDQFLNLQITRPPISEQNRIVRYLGSVIAEIKALVDEATDAVALLQERRAALISAAVTGKIDVREASARNAEAA